MLTIQVLDDRRIDFPDPETALKAPNGLLALGGDLCPDRLTQAYCRGIFPWFSEDEPIMWWSPNPRALITPKSLHISRSMKKCMQQQTYSVAWNTDFEGVIQYCAAPRSASPGTWITDNMLQAYLKLHELGIAHSIEVKNTQNQLVAGLYGICLGPFFFGESMFSREKNTSKLALIRLVQDLAPYGLEFLDCQMMTPHLQTLGAFSCSRGEFLNCLKKLQNSMTDQRVSDETLQDYDMVRHSVLHIYLKQVYTEE